MKGAGLLHSLNEKKLRGKKKKNKEMKGSSYFLVVVMVLVSLLSCFVVECRGEECSEEEKSLLLQLKDSMSHPNGSSYALRNWEGESCCEWNGVYCSDSTSRVFKLLLTGARERGHGIWYLNVTILAQFKELQYLFLTDNQIGGSNTLQGNISPRCDTRLV